MASIRKNVGYNVILNLTNILFPIITIPYISRVLGTENVGVVNFSLTYSGYFMVVAVLGIPIYGMREIAKYAKDKKKRDRIFCEIFSLNIFTAIFFSLIYILTIWKIPTLSENWVIMLVAGTPLYLCAFSVDWYFLGREKFGLITARSFIIKVLCILGMLLFVKSKGDVLFYVIIVAFSTVISNIWNICYLFRYEVVLSIKELHYKNHIKPLLLLLSVQISIALYTVMDTLMLGFLSTFVQVGLYTSVVRTVKTLMGVVNSAGQSVTPKISLFVKEQKSLEVKHIINRTTQFLSFFSVPLAWGTGLIASHFIPFFLGDEFTGAIILMQMMSILFIVYALSCICSSQILIPYEKDKLIFYSTIFGAILNLLLNFLLIPRYAAMGAMISTVLTEIIVTLLLIYYVFKSTPVRLNFSIILKDMLLCIPFVLIHYMCNLLVNTNFSYLLLMILICSIYYAIVQYLSRNYVLLQILTPIKRIL